MEHIFSLPPQIKQYFSSVLLSMPIPKLRDSCDIFERMWKEVLKLWYKLDANPQRNARCEKLKEEILELYERAKIKEKEREGQTDHKTQVFGYRVAAPKAMDRDTYERFAWGRKSAAFKHKFGRNFEIPKKRKG